MNKMTFLMMLLASGCSTSNYQNVAELPDQDGINRIETKDGICYVYGDDDFGSMQCDFNGTKRESVRNVNQNTVNVYVSPSEPNTPASKQTVPESKLKLTETEYGAFGEDPVTGKVYSIIKRK